MNMNRYIKVLCFATLFAVACFTGLAVRAETIYNGAVEADVSAWNTATATKLTVAADDMVAITNGEFKLVAGVPSFGEDSTFKILDGAKLFATNSAKQFALTADNSRILMDGGYLRANIDDKFGLFSGTPKNCRWDLVNGSTVYMTGSNGYPYLSGSNNVICVVNSTNNFNNAASSTHIARSMKFYKAEDCVWAFTNSYLKSFLIGFGNSNEDTSKYGGASYNGYARRNRLIFHNSKTELYNTTRGLHFGARNIINQSFSNRVEVTGTSGNLVLRMVQMRGFADVFRMEGGYVSAYAGITMTGEFNRFENAGGTLTIGVDKGVNLSKHGNVFLNCGGTLSKSATVGGVSNRIELTSGTISGAVTLNGTNGVFRLSGGLFKAALTMSGVSNVYEHVSGVSTGNVTVAGFGNTLMIGPDAELYNTYNSSATLVNALSFSGATNCTLVISNGTFISRTCLAGASGSTPAWWINCPGSAIEFRGRNPSFVFPEYADYWQMMYIGRSTETYPESSPLPDPVKLRFVPPTGNFAAAPIRNVVPASDNRRNIAVYGNAVIEVSDKELPPRSERTSKMRVPLIYCSNSFYGMLDNATRMEQLNSNAILPEGAKLVYDSSAKTLYCELPPRLGLMIILR